MRHAIRIGRSRRCGWRGRHLRWGHGRVARGPGCAPRLPLPAARVIVQRRRDMPLRWINGCAARDRAGCGAVGRPRGAIRARRALADDVAGRAIARFAQGQGIWRSLIGHASSPFPPQRARARPSIPCAARIGVAAAAPGSPLPPRPVHAPPRPAPHLSNAGVAVRSRAHVLHRRPVPLSLLYHASRYCAADSIPAAYGPRTTAANPVTNWSHQGMSPVVCREPHIVPAWVFTPVETTEERRAIRSAAAMTDPVASERCQNVAPSAALSSATPVADANRTTSPVSTIYGKGLQRHHGRPLSSHRWIERRGADDRAAYPWRCGDHAMIFLDTQ